MGIDDRMHLYSRAHDRLALDFWHLQARHRLPCQLRRCSSPLRRDASGNGRIEIRDDFLVGITDAGPLVGSFPKKLI